MTVYLAFGPVGDPDGEPELAIRGWIAVTDWNARLVASTLAAWRARGDEVVLAGEAEARRLYGWPEAEPRQMALPL